MAGTTSRRLAWLGWMVVAAGCGWHSGETFVPPGDQARRSLQSGLETWQSGQASGLLTLNATSGPSVEFIDTHRKPGQRLQAFSVLSMAPGNGPRVFTVRLSLANPREDVNARYVVMGADPLWVIRQEDFDMLAHWDHPMQQP
jgi:hypothetical protein